jgi:hypothetical protein
MTKLSGLTLVCGVALGAQLLSAAPVVRSPISVYVNTGGQADGVSGVTNAINTSGLSTPFVSGVTDWNTYFGSQIHTDLYAGNEWFSQLNVMSVTLAFDMGAQYTIDKMALWNEEVSGISHVDVYTSNDSTFGVQTLVGSFNPVDSPLGFSYSQQIFSLVTTSAQYIKFVATGAPDERIPGSGDGYTSMGEIAFSTDAASVAVPVPAALPAGLACVGLLAAGRIKRRRRD